MKFIWFLYVFLLICVSFGLSWLVVVSHRKSVLQSKLTGIPIPSFLSIPVNAQVTTLDLWKPVLTLTAKRSVPILNMSAESAISYDISTNQLLYAKNQRAQRAMASLTKIMTAIISLEHPKVGDNYLVTDQALVGEDSMGLVKGEILSLKDLLYGAILHSGNDAAMTLAINYPGGVKSFVKAMNEKSLALGMVNTNFTNPTGLQGDGDQHTTALDLLVLTRYALENFPQFREVVKTFDYVIPQTSTHQEYDLENETNLISSYPGVEGVKDGYTPEAGLCLISYLHYDNHQIIAIVMGSDNRRGDMKNLLDFSLEQEGIKPPIHS